MGGLGNQMFMIAHAYSQAIKYNLHPAFSVNLYTTRNYDRSFWPEHFLDNVYRKLDFIDNINDYQIYEEESFWQSKLLDTTINFEKSVLFKGYFQNVKNFIGYEDKILEIFSIPDEFIFKIKGTYPFVFDEYTIALHIRRGDYLTINEILPVIDISYINECMNLIGNYDKILIFSDDISYAESLNIKNKIVVSDLENYECMWLMSLCKAHIMSNSTFSWWAQFLNRNTDKKIFAPTTWFGPKVFDIERMPYHIDYSTKYFSAENWNMIETKFNNGYIIKRED